MINEDFFKTRKPICCGQVREELWGGLYYSSQQVRINLLNSVATFILQNCNGINTVEQIVCNLVNEFDIDIEIAKNDVYSFIGQAWSLKYIKFGDAEFPEQVTGNQENQDKIVKNNGLNTELLEYPAVLGMEPNFLSAPIKVLLELTHNCNLKCVHCFADAKCEVSENGYLEGELNTDEWCRVIDNLVNAGVFGIYLSGGEPLIRKDFNKITAHLKKLGIDFCLLSNLTLIDEKVAKELLESGCYKVEGNLDGFDAESYDSFRGVAGSFEQTIKGIKACQAVGLPVRANVTITKKNVMYLKEIVKTAVNNGISELSCLLLEPGGRGQTNYDDLALSMEEHIKLKDYYDEVANWIYETYKGEFCFIGPLDLIFNEMGRYIPNTYEVENCWPTCGAGKVHASISPRGNLILCPAAGEDLVITPRDCLNNDFSMIWKEADVLNKIRSINQVQCKGCKDINCAGGCHVTVYKQYGSIGANSDPRCRVQYKKMYKQSIKEGEK